jgi:2-polyprenyl-3-methyl-5-hydroxy-6-metoxy-1,4-benzoquinol methylase
MPVESKRAVQDGEQRYLAAEIDADTESGRLQLFELCRDPGTIRRLDRLGVSPGWRCFEVGARRGSIARWLAERVGPTGSVLATDLDTRFLADLPTGVSVRRLDLRHDDIEADRYDLLHCRAVLMHLPDPTAAFARMVAALRPGGLFLIEEGDYGLWSYAGHADAHRLNTIVTHALTRLAQAKVVDSWFGRRLPAFVLASGLTMHGGEVETRIARPGEIDYKFERATLLATTPAIIERGIYGQADAKLIQTVTDHPGSIITTASIVSVWGQKQL